MMTLRHISTPRTKAFKAAILSSGIPVWLSLAFATGLYMPLSAQKLSFQGSPLPVLEDNPDKSTGLDKIYVVYDVNGVQASFTSPSGSHPRWLRYSNLGGGYAEEISDINYSGNVSTLTDLQGDCGYIIEDADKRYYFWVVNYLPHRFSIKSVDASSESDCDASILIPDGSGVPIHYYTISGQQKVLSREIKVNYSTLQWDSSLKLFNQIDASQEFEYLPERMTVRPAALCSTDFEVSGDRFLRQWNWLQTATSSVVSPTAVEVYTEAIQASDSSDSDSDSSSASNLIKGDQADYGGNAPCEISFLAYTSDGVLHHEWQMSADKEFENVDYRFIQQDLTYTFTEEGTLYVRYIGSNADGSCEAVGDTYTVSIGASELLCPNAFSPNGDGVNDEWKVAYRSLLEFQCWIFDRYGNQLFHFTDPSLGWDGTRGGKQVKSGVYYYVIQALGADGKKYKLSGDINILTGKKPDSSGETTE